MNEELGAITRLRKGILVYGETFVVFAIAGNVMLQDWALLAITVPAIAIPWIVVGVTRSPAGPLTPAGSAVRGLLALLLATAILLAVGGGLLHFILATLGVAAGLGLVLALRYGDQLLRRMSSGADMQDA
jgi:hypothetical protein